MNFLTLANGGLKMDFNPDYAMPDDVKTMADQTIQGIIDDSIVVGEAPPAEEPSAEEPASELVFGVVLVGPKNDHGWSQAHAEAAAYVEENLPGSRSIIFESLNPADKPEATLEGVVDDMVADGAALVLTTSDEFEVDTVGVAEKYPDVVFSNVSGDDVLTGDAPPNEGNFMGRMEDMKAIAGCAAEP